MAEVKFMQGNEALAEGCFAAGARFYAGYPITPSSEIAEIASRRLLELGGYYMQMEDELASMAAIIGASLSGIKSFTATSGPGFSLMQENLGVAIMAEVPCVIINVQRSGPSTGLATKPAQADVMQARWGTHGDHAIVALSPSSVQECFHVAVQAFNISEKLRTPVLVLADEIVGHMRENIELPDPRSLEILERKKPNVPPSEYKPYLPEADGVPPLAAYGSDYIFHITSSMHDENGITCDRPDNAGRVIKRLYQKIWHHRHQITISREEQTRDAQILLIAYGATARAARAAVKQARDNGLKVGVLQLITLWPFPEEKVHSLSSRARAVIVPEMNLGQLVYEVERAAKGATRIIPYNKSNGEAITPREILAQIEEVARWLS